MTKEQFLRIKPLALETRDALDGLNSKKSSPGQRFHVLLHTSYVAACELGYDGSERDWLVLVKRARL